MSTIREEEEQEKLNCANSTINNSKNCRCKGSDVICNLSQFLTLVVSLSTLVLLLLMTILAPVVVPNDDGQNSQFVPPRPDVAIWLQQISGFTWMPSYFQVWSSELKNQHHNLTKIEGTHYSVLSLFGEKKIKTYLIFIGTYLQVIYENISMI